MKKMEFTKKEAAEAINYRLRAIQFYTDEGLIIPEAYNPSGRGTTRKYSRKNLLELLLIQILAGNGLTLPQIKTFMEYARAKGIDKKWDPEGLWGKRPENMKAKLYVADAHGNNPQIFIVGSDFDRVNVNLDKFDSVLRINIENLFITVDAVE